MTILYIIVGTIAGLFLALSVFKFGEYWYDRGTEDAFEDVWNALHNGTGLVVPAPRGSHGTEITLERTSAAPMMIVGTNMGSGMEHGFPQLGHIPKDRLN